MAESENTEGPAEQAITEAAEKLRDAISMECGRLADEILGRPEFGTAEWLATHSEYELAAARLEWHLVRIRILHVAGVSPTGDVMNARLYGATWQAIAGACGTTRQAAHDRWAKLATAAGFVSTTTPEDDARRTTAVVFEADEDNIEHERDVRADGGWA
jgi:hypothetical protein